MKQQALTSTESPRVSALRSSLLLHHAIEMPSHGFCLVMDMVDSTKMKVRHVDWKPRFVCFYEAFASLIDKISRVVDLPHPPVRKFLGDAALAYLPLGMERECFSRTPDKQLSLYVLKELRRFMSWLAEVYPVLGIRVRTALCHVEHVELVSIGQTDGPSIDALGQGIDFTFRLEAFATPTSVCINESFRRSLGMQTGLATPLLRLETRREPIKGWEEPCLFHRLVFQSGHETALSGIMPSCNERLQSGI